MKRRPWLNPTFLALALSCGVLPGSAAELPFRDACADGESITIAAVGDVLLHSQLQKQAYGARDGFQKLWEMVTPLLKAADISYANLEGPAAYATGPGGRAVKDPGLKYDGVAYSGYPTFNYHPMIASELKRGGFDLVSTANNHAMDRASVGVDKTIETLRSAGLPFFGTRTRADAEKENGTFRWHVITSVKGWKLAWIACTFSTNGIPDPHHQVLRCFDDADQIEEEIRELHEDPTIDAVIVTPHWGEVEYTHKVEKSQRLLAQRFADAGAAALIGNHPHVTKPMEKIETPDGRESFVIYSIGNFVSAQSSLAQRTSALLYVGLTKAKGKKAWVNGVRYVPLYMLQKPFSVVPTDQVANAPAGSVKLLESLLGVESKLSSREKPLPKVGCETGRQ